jgi:hypothetical protein
MVSELEGAIKEEFALLAAQNCPYTCYTSNTDDYTNYYVWTVKDYEDIRNP